MKLVVDDATVVGEPEGGRLLRRHDAAALPSQLGIVVRGAGQQHAQHDRDLFLLRIGELERRVQARDKLAGGNGELERRDGLLQVGGQTAADRGGMGTRGSRRRRRR